jgi:hypothetical protein
MINVEKEIGADMPKLQTHSQRTFAFILFLAILIFLGQTTRSADGYGVANAQVASETNGSRFFLGTSQDARHCSGAFFVYLDKHRNTGGIFIVSQMDKFRSLNFGDSGDMQFEWTDLGDVNYQFSGHFTPDGFSGDISQQSPKTHTVSYLCELSATELIIGHALSSSANEIALSRFTNQGYSNEGGDPTGVDIRFFPLKHGTAGMITFYAGYWDEPMFAPLVLSNIEKKGSVIHFDAAVRDGLRHYQLVVNAKGGLFCRDDQNSAKKRSCTSLHSDNHVLPIIDW